LCPLVIAFLAIAALGASPEVRAVSDAAGSHLSQGQLADRQVSPALGAWARPGAVLVLPIDPSDAERARGTVPAKLTGGAVLYAPLMWIGSDPDATPPPLRTPESPGEALVARRAAGWMNGPDLGWRWRSFSASEAAARGERTGQSPMPTDGRWYLVIDMPPEASGQDLVLGNRTVTLGWIRPAPFVRPAVAPPAAAGWLNACLSAASRSPLTRWRARLATGAPLLAPGPARDEFEDRAVEALAEQIESQWGEVLERLAAADAELAARLRGRLTATADFHGVALPAWPPDDTALDQLLRDLLSPALSARERSRKGQDWLHSQPEHAAWIADDASLIDPESGIPGVRVAGLTLDPGAGPTALSLKWPSADRAEELATLAPATVGSTVVAIPVAARTEPGLDVSIGGWSARRIVLPGPLVARPPGLPLAPFFEEWSLRSWLASCTDTGDTRTGPSPAGLGRMVADPRCATAAMLIAQDRVGIGEQELATSWVLYLECRTERVPTAARDVTQAPAGSRPKDEVIVALAGVGGQTTLRVFADGQIVTSQGNTFRAPVERTAEGWMAWVPLPQNIIGDGLWVRLGLARLDDTGRRSSWPRPIFPWESVPSHAGVSLGDWSGVREQDRR